MLKSSHFYSILFVFLCSVTSTYAQPSLFLPLSSDLWHAQSVNPAFFPKDKKYIHESYIPVGGGVKFKVSDRVAFNFAYTMNFVEGDNLDAVYGKQARDNFLMVLQE